MSLHATLTANVDSLVKLTLTITNSAATQAVIAFTSGKHFEFTILDSSTGELIWRSGDGMMYTQALSSQALAPGATLTFTAAWQPVNEGSYVATGALMSASHTAQAKTSIHVSPPAA